MVSCVLTQLSAHFSEHLDTIWTSWLGIKFYLTTWRFTKRSSSMVRLVSKSVGKLLDNGITLLHYCLPSPRLCITSFQCYFYCCFKAIAFIEIGFGVTWSSLVPNRLQSISDGVVLLNVFRWTMRKIMKKKAFLVDPAFGLVRTPFIIVLLRMPARAVKLRLARPPPARMFLRWNPPRNLKQNETRIRQAVIVLVLFYLQYSPRTARTGLRFVYTQLGLTNVAWIYSKTNAGVTVIGNWVFKRAARQP